MLIAAPERSSDSEHGDSNYLFNEVIEDKLFLMD